VGGVCESFRQIFWHNKVTKSSWAKNSGVCLLISLAKNYELSVASGCCTKSISTPLYYLSPFADGATPDFLEARKARTAAMALTSSVHKL